MRERRGVEFQFKVLIMEGKEWTEVEEGGGTVSKIRRDGL